tara:strand:+ start:484 stop:1536 length:1053 start_codon:yes stop_codon:yes gene_type:complete
MDWQQTILNWYSENKRSLPWRGSRDPYKIWISEIILQQTKVAYGVKYYKQFIKRFPTIHHLAKADQQTILNLWQGLGYYNRAINLHHTAKYISTNLGGKFPTKFDELIKLKGIGDYTASAISSICFNENVPVVDGNVYRVLSRYFGINTPINRPSAFKVFKAKANELIKNVKSSGDYNQAIMEFGALQCKPKPECSKCILSNKCFAFQHNIVTDLPVKLKKKKNKTRYFNYIVPINKQNKTKIVQRDSSDIWNKLFQFPLIESDNNIRKLSTSFIGNHFDDDLILDSNSIEKINRTKIKHKLTHQTLYISFWKLEINSPIINGVNLSDIDNYPFPVPIKNFINNFINVGN